MQLKKSEIRDLPHYTEGPAMDDRGNIYCTTLTGGEIKMIDAQNNITTWGSSECPNGQAILSNGDHLVCDSALGSIRRFDCNGRFLRDEIHRMCARVKVEVPNDVVVDQQEGFYFTDSIRYDGKVFYRSATGRETLVISGLDYPNGLSLSHDQTTLYIAESYKNRIIRISINAPGISNGEYSVLADLPVHQSGNAFSNLPDGLAIDDKGLLWVAHYGMNAVHVIDPLRALVKTFDIVFPLVSNVFISKNCQLIVTGGYGEPGPGAIAIFTVKY